MDFQVGGVGVFAVDKTGALLSRIGSANAFGTFIIRPYSSASFEVWVGNSRSFQINSGTGVKLSSGFPLSWTNGVDVNNIIDLSILRDAANTLAQRNGVNAQTFRLYNTFTDASNYERGALQWQSNELQLRVDGAGTGQNRALQIVVGNQVVAYFNSAGNRSIALGAGAVATNATSGFVYVPTCAGLPTGTPETYTGLVPIVVDTTNNKLYFYSGGAWRDAGP
jgi:hypothetical protein